MKCFLRATYLLLILMYRISRRTYEDFALIAQVVPMDPGVRLQVASLLMLSQLRHRGREFRPSRIPDKKRGSAEMTSELLSYFFLRSFHHSPRFSSSSSA